MFTNKKSRDKKKKKRDEGKKKKEKDTKKAYYDVHDPYAELYPTNVPIMTEEEIARAIDEGPPLVDFKSPLPEDKTFFDMAAMDRLASRKKLKIPGYTFPHQEVPLDDDFETFKREMTHLSSIQKACRELENSELKKND